MVKLDGYDYSLIFRGTILREVRIKVESTVDVDIADIATALTGSNGEAYAEGHYFKVFDMDIVGGHTGNVYLNLQVIEHEDRRRAI